MAVRGFSQKDSLAIGDRYWEDQLYLTITYNVLNNQPNSADSNGFSYGISAGYIKDIPLSPQGKFAIGIGVGYNYDSYNHGLIVSDSDIQVINDEVLNSKFKTHTIEFPIQFRWRTSDAVTYSFWRVYSGMKLSYNIYNKFLYDFNSQQVVVDNVDVFNKFQAGFEMSLGYGAFNFYVYYGFTPLYKNAILNQQRVKTTNAKFGLIFYLL